MFLYDLVSLYSSIYSIIYLFYQFLHFIQATSIRESTLPLPSDNRTFSEIQNISIEKGDFVLEGSSMNRKGGEVNKKFKVESIPYSSQIERDNNEKNNQDNNDKNDNDDNNNDNNNNSNNNNNKNNDSNNQNIIDMNHKTSRKEEKNEMKFRDENILLIICTDCDRTKTAKAAPGIGKLYLF